MKGRTSFVIAHRLSTIRKADLLLVINEGKIIERGTHTELLEKKGFYYRLYMSQFKGINGESDFQRIETIEKPSLSMESHNIPRIPPMFQERLKDIVKKSRKSYANSPNTAKTIEEMGLPHQFKMMLIHSPIGMIGTFAEVNGKYYLNEERLKQIEARFSIEKKT